MALRDAQAMAVPLVLLQARDECNSVDRGASKRLPNVPNMYHTGNMHRVFLRHKGMRGRLTRKLNATVGLVHDHLTALSSDVVR